MYLATKDGSSCRIPERKAAYYKSMGYSLESLEPEVRTGTSSPVSYTHLTLPTT
mgnify:CR=1 FL=1